MRAAPRSCAPQCGSRRFALATYRLGCAPSSHARPSPPTQLRTTWFGEDRDVSSVCARLVRVRIAMALRAGFWPDEVGRFLDSDCKNTGLLGAAVWRFDIRSQEAILPTVNESGQTQSAAQRHLCRSGCAGAHNRSDMDGAWRSCLGDAHWLRAAAEPELGSADGRTV